MNDVFLNSSNAPYVAELFFKFKKNPSSVDSSWLSFFNSLNEDEISILKDFGGPKWKKRPFKIIITGGFSSLFLNSLRFKVTIDKDITLKGLIKTAKMFNF